MTDDAEQTELTLLPQIWLSFLDSCKDHVTSGGSWQTIQARSSTGDGDDVQI